MSIYICILLALSLLRIGIAIGKKDGVVTTALLVDVLLYVPIYGRVLGWW